MSAALQDTGRYAKVLESLQGSNADINRKPHEETDDLEDWQKELDKLTDQMPAKNVVRRSLDDQAKSYYDQQVKTYGVFAILLNYEIRLQQRRFHCLLQYLEFRDHRDLYVMRYR
jgi:hypothetical protein